MPGGDRTGPMGMGPATGRGAGYCRGYGMPGFAGQWGGGRGMGRGGYGRGRRNRFVATGVPGWAWNQGAGAPVPGSAVMTAGARNRERRNLEQQAEYLKGELEAINQRLNQLASDKEV